MPRRRATPCLLVCVLAACFALLAACGGSDAPVRPAGSYTPSPDRISKVLVIVEENQPYDKVIGADKAPYITALAKEYGSLTNLQAGYRTKCHSLPAYLFLTSGSDHGVCSDKLPGKFPIDGDNLFTQVTAAGKKWRVYGDSMPEPCAKDHADHKVFLVHHTMAPYYTAISEEDCRANDIPMGDPKSGAFAQDVAAGLPDLAFLIPDACHDMHGAKSCKKDGIARGDEWLGEILPTVLNGPDFRANRLLVILTWDEGASKTNHIPTLMIAPGARGIVSDLDATHCTTLRTMSDLLGVEPLNCARDAASLRETFGL